MSAEENDAADTLMEECPYSLGSYVAVSGKVLRGIKIEMHRQGYHEAAKIIGRFAADMEMMEYGAVHLVSRCVLDHGKEVIDARNTEGLN